MVRRNPRITPPSYQRDDEYRSSEGNRFDRPEWFYDTREPSDAIRNYRRRDDNPPRQVDEDSIASDIISAGRIAIADAEAAEEPDSDAPSLRSKTPSSRRKGHADS